MAMTMKGEVELPADRETVWAKLNDPEVLKVCIPGCQSLEKTSDNEMEAVAKVKVGPVSATFKGKVTGRYRRFRQRRRPRRAQPGRGRHKTQLRC